MPFRRDGIKIRNKPSAKALRRAFRIGGIIRSAAALVQSPLGPPWVPPLGFPNSAIEWSFLRRCGWLTGERLCLLNGEGHSLPAPWAKPAEPHPTLGAFFASGSYAPNPLAAGCAAMPISKIHRDLHRHFGSHRGIGGVRFQKPRRRGQLVARVFHGNTHETGGSALGGRAPFRRTSEPARPGARRPPPVEREARKRENRPEERLESGPSA